MVKRANKQLQLYRVNPATNRVVVEIAMSNYLDYFHEWDNAVFKKRDLHPELAQFLDLCSEDIPLKRQLEIEFCITNRSEDVEKEALIIASYRNYYNSQNRMLVINIRRSLRYSLILTLVAIGFITLYSVLKGHVQEHVSLMILMEGLQIGGWVFMWEAFHTLFIHTLDPLKRRRELARFLGAEISFKTVGQL